MLSSPRNTFKKSERLCSRIQMDCLFQGDNRTATAYPLRAVFLPVEEEQQKGVSILISVPKKRFHDAVDRNRAQSTEQKTLEVNTVKSGGRKR